MADNNTVLTLQENSVQEVPLELQQTLFNVGRALLNENPAEIQNNAYAMKLYDILKSSGLGGTAGSVVPIFVTGNCTTLPETANAAFTLVPVGNNVYRVDADIPRGRSAASFNISVGTVNTLPEGSPAAASMSQDPATGDVTADFDIPVGATGPTGPQGPQGPIGPTPTLTVGTVTTVSPNTPANLTLKDLGGGNYSLDADIPKGDVGFAPTSTVTVTSGSLGDELTVTVTDATGTTSETLSFDDSLFDPVNTFVTNL